MYHIKTLNNIAPKGLAELPAQQFTVNSGVESFAQGILVRSASMHETPLPEGLLAVAPARGGREHPRTRVQRTGHCGVSTRPAPTPTP